ncbi:hypothetical protein A0H81_14095 [Grifola frondosa]|uniref:Uncharacterized protein n=1 Tax=Grifola frondosa TaxID=5627 RepID=A0A1C7LPE4_GRIFR|nr:hypothetical protein A0H81_14095 [Grifola frondosa]
MLCAISYYCQNLPLSGYKVTHYRAMRFNCNRVNITDRHPLSSPVFSNGQNTLLAQYQMRVFVVLPALKGAFNMKKAGAFWVCKVIFSFHRDIYCPTSLCLRSMHPGNILSRAEFVASEIGPIVFRGIALAFTIRFSPGLKKSKSDFSFQWTSSTHCSSNSPVTTSSLCLPLPHTSFGSHCKSLLKVQNARGLGGFVSITILTAASVLFIFVITIAAGARWSSVEVFAPLIIPIFMITGFFVWVLGSHLKMHCISYIRFGLPPSACFTPGLRDVCSGVGRAHDPRVRKPKVEQQWKEGSHQANICMKLPTTQKRCQRKHSRLR